MKKTLTTFLLFFGLILGHAQNQNISNGNVFEGEPFLAINPTNSQNIVAAWMGFVFGNGSALTIRVKSSFNGGLTWSAGTTLPHINQSYQSADVSMAFATNGTLFLSYIDHRESPDSGGVYICKSLDGGLTWSTPVKAIDAYADGSKLPLDRPWLVSDPSGTDLFLTTKPAPTVAPPNRAYLIHSGDGGTTWQPWRYVDSTNNLIGSLIAAPMAAPTFAGQHTFHAVYPSYVASQNILPRFILATSTNGGAHLSYQTVFAGVGGTSNDSVKAAYRLVADPSDSLHLGFVYTSAVSGDYDIYFTETYNGGANWSASQRINDDAYGNGKIQDLVWADFDTDGDLVVSWRDRRSAPGSSYAAASQFYYAYRSHDSITFQSNQLLSDSLVAFNNILSGNGNDFMCVAFRNDTISAAWGETRDGSLDIWFVRMRASTGAPAGIALISSGDAGVEIFPNPATDFITISLADQARVDEVRVYDLSGKLIRVQAASSAQARVDLRGMSAGVYVVEVRSAGRQSVRRVVKD